MQTFADAFTHEGLNVWWDQALRSGETYDQVTEAALRSAQAVVVLWSPRSVASNWVRSEATIGHRAKKLIPVNIEACDKPVMFELTQTADLSHWKGNLDDSAWRAFLDDVKRLVAEPSGDSGEPARPVSPARHIAAGAKRDAGSIPFLQRKSTRRGALAGIVALGAGGAAAYVFRDSLALQFTNLGAADLVRQGQELQKSAEPGSPRRALAYFKKATTIDPGYAPAWAAMAMAYRHPLLGGGELSEPSMSQPPLIRAAAKRALELDPGNAEAQLALMAIDPAFRHWQKQESDFRAYLEQFPKSALGHSFLGKLLATVGRTEEAVVHNRRAVELDPELVIGWGILAMNLSHLNRGKEAHDVLDQGFSRFPAHVWLWQVRFLVLLDEKRYREAAAFVRDPEGMPDVVGRQGAEQGAKLADALANGTANEKTAEDLFCIACKSVESAPMVVPEMVQCGATALAFTMLEAYYFGGEMRGISFPPPSDIDERMTFMLFEPALTPLRSDPRFASILERTGLEDYWRKTGTQPDYRKG